MNIEKEIILTIRDLNNLFERDKLESLPKEWLVELLVRHLKREIKAIEYLENINKRFEEIPDKELLTNRAIDISVLNEIKNILKGE